MNPHVFTTTGILIPVLLGMLFTFSNGYRDSSTIVATVVSTRALTPNWAFLLCALFEFLGALFLGTAVASTISGSFFSAGFKPSHNDVVLVLCAALGAAIAWGALSWWRAWPASNSHSLMAGLFGAAVAMWGFGKIQNPAMILIVIVLIVSPFVGFVLSIGVSMMVRWIGSWMTIKAKPLAAGLHVLSCLCVAGACGANGGQLALGALLPVVGIMSAGTEIPFGLRMMVAIALSLGVLLGGRRLLKKLGMKFYRIRDAQGLSAEMASASTIIACQFTGFPASTTQVIAGSIVGAGVAKNPRMVRWSVVNEIMLSWAITLPAVSIISFIACQLLKAGWK